MEKRREKKVKERKVLFVSLLLLSLLLGAPASMVRGNPDGTGVAVLNVPPTISYVHFSSADGIHRVEVTVLDYNSWKDVYQIRLEFRADDGPLSVITYTQYSDRGNLSTRVDWFNETDGHYLLQSMSGVRRVFNGTTVPEKCEINVTFALRPIEALKVVMTVEDLSGEKAVARVDYPPLFGGISLRPEPISTDFIAVALSVFGTVAGIKMKYGSFTKPIKNLRNGVKGVRKK